MQVFNTFFKIANKNKKAAILYFSIFLIIVICFSQMGASEAVDKFVAKSINFTVIDSDNSKASKALTDYLSSKHSYVELKSYEKEDLQDYLYYETVSYILYIPEGFQDNLLVGDTDNLLSHTMKSDSASGYFFNQDVSAYLETLKLYMAGGYTFDEALEKTYDTATAANENEVELLEFQQNTAVENSAFYYYFQYYAYVLISILLMGLSPILIIFHNRKLRDRLSCSSYSLRKQNISIGLASATYALLLWLLLIIAAGILYGFSNLFSSSGLMCMLNSLVYELVIVALTLLIGSFSLEANSLNLISNVIGLGTSFLCGVFVPLWSLSDKVKFFSKFMPTYWYISNNNMLAGFSGEAVKMQTYFTNLGIQLVFAAAIISVYVMFSKQRQKNAL